MAAHVPEDANSRLDRRDSRLDRNELAAEFIFENGLNPASWRCD